MTFLLLLADDDEHFRALLRKWFEQQSEYTLIGEAIDGLEAVEMTLKLEPDILLMDISMPRLNGIEATKEIMAKRPDTRVIGLSIHAEKEYRSEMYAAGACAYILKENLVDDLMNTIQSTIMDK